MLIADPIVHAWHRATASDVRRACVASVLFLERFDLRCTANAEQPERTDVRSPLYLQVPAMTIYISPMGKWITLKTRNRQEEE